MRRSQLTGLALLTVLAGTAITTTQFRLHAVHADRAAPLPDEIPIAPPDPSQEAIDRFSWETFIALNHPAALDGQGRPIRDNGFSNGKPDLTKPLDAPGPRVWEGLKADHELFRHGGKAPTAWNEYDNELPCSTGSVEERSGEKILTLISEGTSMQQGINQAMAGPLIDRFGSYVHYEVRHNKPYYEFVRDNKFYIREELDKKHRWPRKMLQLPISDPDKKTYGSLEVKAAWRILDSSEDESTARRYYWTWARVPDPVTGKCGPRQRVALVGLHIIQKVKGFNSWLWATFEHVDNVPCNYSDMTKCPVAPMHFSFNANNADLDEAARKNRGYVPQAWTVPKLGAKWKPIDPQRLPPEPVAVAERIHAVRMTAVQPSATARNSEFHARSGIKGTVWENYILIDTQWPRDGNGAVKPPNLGKEPTDDEYAMGALNPEPGPNARDNVPVANITMETYYQKPNRLLESLGASCMHCHYAAAQTDFSWTLANRSWPPTRAKKLSETPAIQ